MHWIYLIHEFHNLSWITEINELFHDILIYWDAPVYNFLVIWHDDVTPVVIFSHNPDAYLKINCIKNCITKPSSIWNLIKKKSKLGGLSFLLMCSIMKIPIKLALFHWQMSLAWSLIFKPNFTRYYYLIWNNMNLYCKQNSLFFDNWFKNCTSYL